MLSGFPTAATATAWPSSTKHSVYRTERGLAVEEMAQTTAEAAQELRLSQLHGVHHHGKSPGATTEVQGPGAVGEALLLAAAWGGDQLSLTG